MAYDCDMSECVEVIDQKSKNMFPFIKPKPRDPRLRQPILPFEPPVLEEALNERYLVKPEDIDDLLKQEKERISAMKNAVQNETIVDEKGTKKGDNDAESVGTGNSKRTCSDLNLSTDELSQVFGRDDGYETMSPISPLVPMKFDYHGVPDFSKPVSVRGTRASHLIRAHNASKVELLKLRSSSAKKDVGSVGSYNFESRKWKVSHSAPQERNCSLEDTPRSQISSVRVGLPFIHGKDKLSSSTNYSKQRSKTAGRERMSLSSDPGRQPWTNYRSKSAHSNVSPYSQVAKLLEQSRLFSPLIASKPQLPLLRKLHTPTNNNSVVKTRINYIYTDRGSAKSRHGEAKTDLLPKRKLTC